MFKRVIWMGLGAAAGSVGTVWTQRKVRSQLERARPRAVVDRAIDGIGGMRETVVAAIDEGRATMRASESQMRSDVSARTSARRAPRRAG